MKWLLISLLLLSGCKKDIPDVVHTPVLSLSIDMLLPTDSSGYSYYELYNPNGQNIHTITGKLLIDGKPPVVGEPVIVNWESSHTWVLQKGKVVYTLTKSYINPLTGLWTTTILPSVISQTDYVVPTINKSCYVNTETGDIFSVIAPIGNMKGDTMTIKASVNSTYATKVDKDGFEYEWKKDSAFVFKKIILK